MSGSTTLSGGAVWLRVGIFVAASLTLSWASARLLDPLLSGLSQGGEPTLGMMLIPTIAWLPTLGAAVLAWLIPRPLSLRAGGSAKPWFLCLVLFLVGAGLHLALMLNDANVNGWSDTGSMVAGATTVWLALLTALPAAALQVLVSLTLLWGIARQAMPAARAGVVTAVALALPGIVATGIAALRGSAFTGNPDDPSGGSQAFAWVVSTVVQLAAWALVYSGVGRLVDGRGPAARWFLSLLGLLPLFAAPAGLSPFLSWPSAAPSLWGLVVASVAAFSPALLVGALAWALSAARASGVSTRSAAMADAAA